MSIRQEIIKSIKKFIESKYLPFIVLTMIMVLIHIKMNCNFGDDLHFMTAIQTKGLWHNISWSYNNWGSPGILSFCVFYLVLLPQEIFKICNIMIVLLAAYSISILTNHDKNKLIDWIIALFIIIYPFSQMSTAGWIVTSVAYMFHLSFGLYSLTPIKRILMGEKTNYIATIIALLVALGAPQMACILTGVYLLFFLYAIKSKKPYKFFLSQTIISILYLLYHITAPGNKSRYISEVITWFPDFNMISFINKIKLGFADTMVHFWGEPNIFFAVFCILLFLAVFYKYKELLYRIIAAMPLVGVLAFGFFNNITSVVFPKLVELMNTPSNVLITTENFMNIRLYVPIFVWTLLCGFIMLSIYIIFKNSIMSLLVNVIFMAGFASRMIMSFSPTLYASLTRTFIFMYFSIIICGVFIFKEICKDISLKKQQDILILVGMIAMINFVEYII